MRSNNNNPKGTMSEPESINHTTGATTTTTTTVPAQHGGDKTTMSDVGSSSPKSDDRPESSPTNTTNDAADNTNDNDNGDHNTGFHDDAATTTTTPVVVDSANATTTTARSPPATAATVMVDVKSTPYEKTTKTRHRPTPSSEESSSPIRKKDYKDDDKDDDDNRFDDDDDDGLILPPPPPPTPQLLLSQVVLGNDDIVKTDNNNNNNNDKKRPLVVLETRNEQEEERTPYQCMDDRSALSPCGEDYDRSIHGWPRRQESPSEEIMPPPQPVNQPVVEGTMDGAGRHSSSSSSSNSSHATTTVSNSRRRQYHQHHTAEGMVMIPYNLMAQSFDTISTDGGGEIGAILEHTVVGGRDFAMQNTVDDREDNNEVGNKTKDRRRRHDDHNDGNGNDDDDDVDDDEKPLPLDYRHPGSTPSTHHENDHDLVYLATAESEEKLKSRLSPLDLHVDDDDDGDDEEEDQDHSPPQRVIHMGLTGNNSINSVDGPGGRSFSVVGGGDISPIDIDGDGYHSRHYHRGVSFMDPYPIHDHTQPSLSSSDRPRFDGKARGTEHQYGWLSSRHTNVSEGRAHTQRSYQRAPFMETIEGSTVRPTSASHYPEVLPPPVTTRPVVQPSPPLRGQYGRPPRWMSPYQYPDHLHFPFSHQHHQYDQPNPSHPPHQQQQQQQQHHRFSRRPSPPSPLPPTTGYYGASRNGGQYHHSNPFFVLRSFRPCFDGCSYLLQCLKDHPIIPVNVSAHGQGVHYEDHQTVHLNPDDLKVATCRIESTICALGGYIQRGTDFGVAEADDDPSQPMPRTTQQSVVVGHNSMVDRSYSMFGETNIATHHHNHVGRTMNQHAGLAPRSSPSHDLYISLFHQRYFVGGNCVSWEVEESPPIMIPSQEMTIGNDAAATDKTNRSKHDSVRKQHSSKGKGNRQVDQEGNNSHSRLTVMAEDGNIVDMMIHNNEKMKYRCKLCGQPKQNHNCPYQQSLQRSIAVMVDPTVHAYTSAEPGVLTPTLSDMNNFVSYVGDDDDDDGIRNGTVDADADVFDSETAARDDQVRPPTTSKVTPDNVKAGSLQNSPDTSTLSTAYSLCPPPGEARVSKLRDHDGGIRRYGSRGRGAKMGDSRTTRPLPTSTLSLRPEHYRAVSFELTYSKSKGAEMNGDYTYQHVPLTFQGRKRLSDTLFFLSKDIPNVLSDVASLLRVAREQDDWDLAVAEILTQVVVGLFCTEGDYQLDGLRTYLLNIGISS